VGLKEVLDLLDTNGSVKAAFVLEGEFYRKVIAEERSVTECAFGMPFVNRALDEVLKRNVAVCLFASGNLENIEEHIMIMEDKHGNIVGHDVPKCMVDDYKDNPDIVWLSEDFAIYPDRMDLWEAAMVLLPNKVSSIGKNEGVEDAIMLYPATTTDMLLKEHFMIPDNKVSTAILAFNII
jgi:hypothetical protein